MPARPPSAGRSPGGPGEAPGEVDDAPDRPPAGRRIRVLLVIKGLGPGGAERLLLDTLRAGDTDRFDYEVASVLAAADGLVPDVATQAGAFHALGATSNLDLRWVPRFRRLVGHGRFDIVHFHLPYTAALGRPAVLSLPRRRRPVTLYTEHSLWNKVSPPVKALNRSTISADRALIAVSDAALGALPDRLRRRARVVVHGIDTAGARRARDRRPDIRAEVRRELGAAGGELLVVTVAGMRAEKGYDVLLDAARLCTDKGLPLRFAAAGEGALRPELEEQHRSLGLGDRFAFLGHRPDALALMVAADIVVLPSRQEGLPVVLMEATSLGSCIVASDVGGVPQVIEDGRSGVLVPPGDPAALAAALGGLSADPQVRAALGRAALDEGARFDVRRSAAEIEDLYRRLVASRT